MHPQENVKEGLLTAEDVASTLSRVVVGGTLEDAVENAELIVEAIHEDVAAKRAVFAQVIACVFAAVG